MKTLIIIILSFILGLFAGQYWGIEKTKEEALQMIEKGIDAWLESFQSSEVAQDLTQQASDVLQQQLDQVKETAKQEAQQALSEQVDQLFN